VLGSCSLRKLWYPDVRAAHIWILFSKLNLRPYEGLDFAKKTKKTGHPIAQKALDARLIEIIN
jgi:hypothetical protein